MELVAELRLPGLIVYYNRNRTTPSPQPIPVAIPQNLVDKLVRILKDAGDNVDQMEREVALYLQQNPEVRTALKVAGYVAVGAFVVYIIANDATLVGILDDVAGLRIAWSMVMILNKL